MTTAEEWLRKQYFDDETGDWYRYDVCEAMKAYAEEKTKDMYPKEFVEWLIWGSKSYVINTNNKWWCTEENKYMNIDELFDHWKNEKK